MESIVTKGLDKDLDKVKTFLQDKEAVRQGSISSSLKMSSGKVSEILSVLEDEGFVRKTKGVYKGHRVNTIHVLKDRIMSRGTFNRAMHETTKPTGQVFFESPCFFCKQLDTCGDNTQLSYLNCPRLDEWIGKRLN